MGRDRRDRVSVATYQDVANTIRQTESVYDCMVDVLVTASKSPNALYVEATTVVWLDDGRKHEFRTGRYCNSVSAPLASVIYQTVTRLHHDVELRASRVRPRE